MLGPGAREPCDFGGDGDAGGESVAEVVADVRTAADVCREGGLEEAGDAEGGRDEDDAEGRGGADEEVLGMDWIVSDAGRGGRIFGPLSWEDLRSDRPREVSPMVQATTEPKCCCVHCLPYLLLSPSSWVWRYDLVRHGSNDAYSRYRLASYYCDCESAPPHPLPNRTADSVP